MWGEPGHDFKAGFRMAGNGVVYASPMFGTADGDTVVYVSIDCGGTYVKYRAMIEHSNPFDQRPHIQLDVDKLSSMELRLYITATDGTVHAWNVVNLENHAGNMGCNFTSMSRGNYQNGDNKYGIGEPACAASCISVAAHRSEWLQSDSVTVSGGTIASFSSYGPIIDGRQKPEISAPGVDVISSISAWCDGLDGYIPYESFTVQNVKYVWSNMSGTSMSCPAVTGVVALMLQANPALSVDQVREILFSTARNDSLTGPLVAEGRMDVHWGWGKVDALKAVNECVRRVSINEVESSRTPLKVFPNPTTGMVSIHTGCGEQQTLSVYTIDGRLVLQTPVTTDITLDVSSWNQGIYILRIGSRTEKLIVK
jgi:hypothetical protein